MRCVRLHKPIQLAEPAETAGSGVVTDTFGRPLKNLRVSLIDRCNLRCHYCMPEEQYLWLSRDDILSVDEIARTVGLFCDLGVDRVRLTGGEPLLRPEVHEIVGRIASDPRVRDLSMTTNGVLLARHAASLRRAGLDRVSVSLDTLDRARFRELARRDRLDQVLAGIDAAARVGLQPLKINTVIIRGDNDDELVSLLEYGKDVGAEVRFIEYMDVGGATRWSMDRVVSRREMLDRLESHYGAIEPLNEATRAPADRFRLPDGTVFGIIASTTEPFCSTCDRSRLTADGMWLLCLYAESGLDLREPLRSGATADEIRELITGRWSGRADRGAEERKRLNSNRGPLYQIEDLRKDPHREMHTRGG